MMDFLAVLERADDGSWSAYVPDLPGCTSAGATRIEAAANVRAAVLTYIDELVAEGRPAPSPASFPEVVHIAV